MPALDGHYRHGDSAIVWDDAGVTLARQDRRGAATAGWDQVDGARQIGERPGFVQLIVRGHVPPADPRDDPFAIAVNSNPDAKRLVTVLGWRAAAARARRLGQVGAKSGAPGWFRARERRG